MVSLLCGSVGNDGYWQKPFARQGVRWGKAFADLGIGRRLPTSRKSEAVTKLVPSAKADSVCSTFAFPALTCRAIGCRRYAAVAGFVPPSPCSIEFRNDRKPRDVGHPVPRGIFVDSPAIS